MSISSVRQSRPTARAAGSSGDPGEDEDEMIEEAIDVIMESRQASTSMLQRRLKLGYSRAARIIDQIEERGIIGRSRAPSRARSSFRARNGRK